MHAPEAQGRIFLPYEVGGTFCLCKHDHDLLKTSDVQIEPDTFVKDNAKLELGDGVIRVLHTPGHTRGSLCFYVKDADILFSGRTLEKDGYGTILGAQQHVADAVQLKEAQRHHLFGACLSGPR